MIQMMGGSMSETKRLDVELTLRDIAVRLGQIPQVDSYYSFAARELLTLLRTGELRALAYFPSQMITQLPIHPDYWRSISNRRFRKIESSDKPGRKGTYTLPARDLYESYLEALLCPTSESLGAELDAVKNDLKSVQDKLNSFCEVLVRQSEWNRFLSENGYTEETEEEVSEDERPEGETRGRPHKNWRDMIPYFVCVLGEKIENAEKYEALATEIRELAMKDKIVQVPEVSTLKDEVSKVIRVARKVKTKAD